MEKELLAKAMTYQDLIDLDYEEAEIERRLIQNGETLEEIALEALEQLGDDQ